MSDGKQAQQNGVTYADAGVDISAGNALVEAIKPLAKATRRKGTDSVLGGFGGLFDLKACGYKDPVLVAANDGVGTKLRVAIETGLHLGVGIDFCGSAALRRNAGLGAQHQGEPNGGHAGDDE